MVVMASNGIPFPLTNPLHYVNPFLSKMVPLLKGTILFFPKTTAIPGSNGWGLVIYGTYNGWQQKLHQKWVQQPFPFH